MSEFDIEALRNNAESSAHAAREIAERLQRDSLSTAATLAEYASYWLKNGVWSGCGFELAEFLNNLAGMCHTYCEEYEGALEDEH